MTDDTLAIIRQLVGQDNVLVIHRLFVDFTGKLETALFLSQLLYWSDKGGRDDGFIYKSRREWREELAISDRQVRQAAATLKEMGLLETKKLRARGAPTLHYRLDQAALYEALARFVQMNKSDLSTRSNEICSNGQNLNIEHTETTGHGDGVQALIALQDLGVNGAEGFVREHDAGLILGWVSYVEKATNLTDPAAFVASKLKAGEKPPKKKRKKSGKEKYLTGKYAHIYQH